MAQEPTWTHDLPGIIVRMRDNPGRQGTTTGRTRQAGTFTLVQVNFGPGDTQYKRYNLLEPIENEEDLHDMLRAGRFGGPTDLRRVLALEKIRGELTKRLLLDGSQQHPILRPPIQTSLEVRRIVCWPSSYCGRGRARKDHRSYIHLEGTPGTRRRPSTSNHCTSNVKE